MVPKGWRSKPIDEIATILVGRDLKEDSYSEVRTENHIYPVYSNTVEERGLYGFYDFPEYPGNAVTVVGRGIGLGRAFARYENEGFGAIGRLLVLCPKGESFDVVFLTDYINFKLRIYNESGGIPQLPGSAIAKYKVTLPPITEQRKIARILSTWDEAVATTEQLLANSEQQKKALMQQLLTGKKRLPGFRGRWRKGLLGDVASIDSGYAFKSTDFTGSDEGIPIIRMSDFKSGGLEISSAARIPRELLAGLEKFQLRRGDFVFGMSGSLSNYAWIRPHDLPCYLNQRVGRIVAKSDGNQLFVTYLYLSDKVQRYILDMAAGAAQLNISINDLRGMPVSYPCLEEQEGIAAVLSKADQRIEWLRSKAALLKVEKKALMQQLLTGKRRVKVDQGETEPATA